MVEGYTNGMVSALLRSHAPLDAQPVILATSSTHISLVLAVQARMSSTNALSQDRSIHQDGVQLIFVLVQSMSHQSIAQATSVHHTQPSTAGLAKELIQKQ